ncbi:MAG: DUF192 domain-containing protein [Actinobacteria bacterium]|nr:DUF192 domain-containing protein [Actinomycetota bacterium]
MVNATRGEVLARDAQLAESAGERRRGLIGRDGLKPGEGLILPRCRQVHSFGMRFPIDVVFIDRSGVVVMTCPDLEPRSISSVAWRARVAIELPAGTIERARTLIGDRITVKDRIS